MTFAEALNWEFIQSKPKNGSAWCGNTPSNNDFGQNFTVQCFCESPLPNLPVKCANEGEDCECKGRVFYGPKTDPKKNEDIEFEVMVNISYAHKMSTTSLGCNNKVFGDPTPGLSKACFCDADLSYTQDEIDYDTEHNSYEYEA